MIMLLNKDMSIHSSDPEKEMLSNGLRSGNFVFFRDLEKTEFSHRAPGAAKEDSTLPLLRHQFHATTE